jgi:N-acylglucosamine-6-phosphate 2-epimerase
MDLGTWFATIRGGLIVSCQALPGEPLHGSEMMAAMARAAALGGAVAIRANGPEDIAAIRAAVDLAIIGLYKVDLPGLDVRITPSITYAEEIAAAGADVIALDATARPHPGGVSVAELIAQVHQRTGLPVLADVATLEEGLAAAAAGAELVATTLSGYTAAGPALPGPDFALVERLAVQLAPRGVPLIAEGRIATPEQAAHALRLGAHAVVVGGAITRPQAITARFAEALKAAARNSAELP